MESTSSPSSKKRDVKSTCKSKEDTEEGHKLTNKERAKIHRARKKKYYEQLEKKVEKLEKEVQKLKDK